MQVQLQQAICFPISTQDKRNIERLSQLMSQELGGLRVSRNHLYRVAIKEWTEAQLKRYEGQGA